MNSYPIFLNLENRPCLVVGGGRVATRKVQKLLDFGANVTVVSLTFTHKLEELFRMGAINKIQRKFVETDVDDKFLVVAATNNTEFNNNIFTAAERKFTFCIKADSYSGSSANVASSFQNGLLNIAVSTSGASPVLSMELSKYFENKIPETIIPIIEDIKAVRKEIISTVKDEKEKTKLLNEKIQPKVDTIIELLKKYNRRIIVEE